MQGDKEVNSFDNAAEPALPFALADGATSNFGVRKIAKSFKDGSVQVVLRSPSASGEISWKLLALHNSATGTLGDPPPIDPAGSSYNRTTNRLDLTFTAALDPAWVIKVDTVDAASGNAVKINIDPANIAPNGLSLSQVMTAPLLSGFKVSIAGTEVGGDQSKVYSKADVYLGPVAGATGPLAGTTGSVTEGNSRHVEGCDRCAGHVEVEGPNSAHRHRGVRTHRRRRLPRRHPSRLVPVYRPGRKNNHGTAAAQGRQAV